MLYDLLSKPSAWKVIGIVLFFFILLTKTSEHHKVFLCTAHLTKKLKNYNKEIVEQRA